MVYILQSRICVFYTQIRNIYANRVIFPGNKPATDENFKSLALADREITPLAINPSALDTLPKSQTLNGLKN